MPAPTPAPKPDELAEALRLLRAWLGRHYPAWRSGRLEVDVDEPEKLSLPILRSKVPEES